MEKAQAYHSFQVINKDGITVGTGRAEVDYFLIHRRNKSDFRSICFIVILG